MANFLITRNFNYESLIEAQAHNYYKKLLNILICLLVYIFTSLNLDRFHLIMITEKLEESLILMKEKLNLKFSDISSFAKNIATKSKINKNDNKFLNRKIQKWLDVDFKLYQFFNQQFEERIEKFGRGKMRKAVEQLRKFNKPFV